LKLLAEAQNPVEKPSYFDFVRSMNETKWSTDGFNLVPAKLSEQFAEVREQKHIIHVHIGMRHDSSFTFVFSQTQKKLLIVHNASAS